MTPGPVAGSPEQALAGWSAVRAAQGRRPSTVAVAGTAQQLDGALVVVVPGEPIGGYAAGRVSGEVLDVLAVEVLPVRRRAGLGAALADALADLAYGAGARRVRASAGPEQFWRALGLTPDGDVWWGDLDPPERTVVLHAGGLRLGQLLKAAGLVDTGAQAKGLLAEGSVAVGGEPETRRGRQLTVGDVVSVGEQTVRVVAPG